MTINISKIPKKMSSHDFSKNNSINLFFNHISSSMKNCSVKHMLRFLISCILEYKIPHLLNKAKQIFQKQQWPTSTANINHVAYTTKPHIIIRYKNLFNFNPEEDRRSNALSWSCILTIHFLLSDTITNFGFLHS